MKKRNAEDDLKYANTVLEEYIPTDGFEEVMIIRHWIPRAVKAEKKAKFYANRAALWHRLAKKLNGPMLYEKPQGQWLKGTPEKADWYLCVSSTLTILGVFYFDNEIWVPRGNNNDKYIHAFYSIPIEIPSMPEETDED